MTTMSSPKTILCNVISIPPPATRRSKNPAGKLLKRQSHQLRQSIDAEQPRTVGRKAGGIDHRREQGRPKQLASHFARDRRARIGPRTDAAVFMLASHAERERQEQHDPP